MNEKRHWYNSIKAEYKGAATNSKPEKTDQIKPWIFNTTRNVVATLHKHFVNRITSIHSSNIAHCTLSPR